jgi:hypothetical protein
MLYYSVIKKNEILSFTGKWMELENIILSEVTQVQKTKVACFLSYVEDRCKYKYNHYQIDNRYRQNIYIYIYISVLALSLSLSYFSPTVELLNESKGGRKE